VKYHIYQYKNVEVHLEFSFEDNDQTDEKKRKFLALLEQAAHTLQTELNS